MTNHENAERLRIEYITHIHPESKTRNICTAQKYWNGCDYADDYAGAGLECWKQGDKHNCIRCRRMKVNQKEGV